MTEARWAIEAAYGVEPESRLYGCASCSVTWFGADDRCWVCGARAPAGDVGEGQGESESFLARIDDEA